MFELIVFIVAVLFVLNAHDRKRKAQAIAAHQFIDLVHELQLPDDCFAIDVPSEIEFEPISDWERASAIALADELIAAIDLAHESDQFISECAAIAPVAKPVELPNNDTQIRALCKLYQVPVGTRGRVNRKHRQRLAQAIA